MIKRAVRSLEEVIREASIERTTYSTPKFEQMWRRNMTRANKVVDEIHSFLEKEMTKRKP